ncbi:PTS system sugar-specific transporter subunit EII [Streptococcus varani]|jgi:PTS system N-acetylgalactosamine-specific IIA component|uniref:PTS system sugar-specific transporter subunit EII n=1 Tax=Streptococcus varani TaxID=1608583 RepID=A0A0E4H2U0_9STRE|nr:PTS sugar transporter subunit IIA [Streptococcus varani]CQR24012.1 PTS system sugar-specific transporter subunit EII [Streptococcus varani]
MKVILLGHGHCASGYLSSLEMIAGKQEHVEAIDFSDSMTSQELEEKLEVSLVNEDEVLILCDLLGGTPFKLAAARALRSETQTIEAISGLNLSMLLEVALGVTSLGDDAVEKVIFSAKSGIMSAKDLFKPSAEAEEDGEGI